MGKEIEKKENEEGVNEDWLDDTDAELPEELQEGKKSGKPPQNTLKKKIALKVRDWAGGKDVKFKAALDDTVGEAFVKAAEALDKSLLPPPPNAPLDLLRVKLRNGQWSAPFADFDEPLWLFLLRGFKRHFAVEYLLIVKINTQWGVAPSENATPRELLSAFGMDAQEFSLYTLDGSEPLPVDTPLSLERGDKFEAQKDGRYGAADSGAGGCRTRPRGSQTIEEDAEILEKAGVKARLHLQGGQKYVEIRAVKIPSPPWGKAETNILIAVPATYPSGGLDALYIEMPITHSSGSIPYQQQTLQVDGRTWMLISWHYHESRPWNPLHDDLASHIEHCRGFFLTRGVKQ